MKLTNLKLNIKEYVYNTRKYRTFITKHLLVINTSVEVN